MARWGELERTLEQPDRGFDVELDGSRAGHQQGSACRRLELPDTADVTGRACEIECGRVVVSQDVCDILDPIPGLPFDPRGRGDVAHDTGRSRKGRVGDIAHEDVPERVL